MAWTTLEIWNIHNHIHKCNCSRQAFHTVLYCCTVTQYLHKHIVIYVMKQKNRNLLLTPFGTFAGLETCAQVGSLVCEEAFEVQGTSLFPDSLAPTKGRTNRKQQVTCGSISTNRSGQKSACQNRNIGKLAMEQGLPFTSPLGPCTHPRLFLERERVNNLRLVSFLLHP